MTTAQQGDAPSDDGMLAQVVARLSAEVTAPLTQALGMVAAAASSGQIDRSSLLALRRDITNARRAGLLGQQIARLATGFAQPGIEPVDLDQVLRSVLTEQAANATAGMQGHGHSLVPVTVMADTSMVYTMLQAAADWAQRHARSPITWDLVAEAGQPLALLHCCFDLRTEPGNGADSAEQFDSLDWLMMRYAGHLSGASVERCTDGPRCRLTMQFKHLAHPRRRADHALNGHAGHGLSPTSLNGCQVLVLAARRDARQRVREALQGHEVFIDYVPSVAAAQAYCDECAPEVLIHEAGFHGEALLGLRARLAKQKPGVAMIEVLPSGHGCELSTTGLKLGADGLQKTLGAMLQMELAMKA